METTMARAAISISFTSFMARATWTPILWRHQATTKTPDGVLPSRLSRVILWRPQAMIGTRDVRPRRQFQPRKPSRAGDLALSPAAQAQPRRLVAVGAAGARRGAARQQADPAFGRLR